MMPYINNKPYGLRMISSSNITKHRKTLCLDYTEETMVEQPVTSNKLISVQPFLFAQFVGEVNLSPDMDFWVSTKDVSNDKDDPYMIAKPYIINPNQKRTLGIE